MIVDANVVVGAVLGRSLPRFVDLYQRGIGLFIPEEQWHEVYRGSYREAAKLGRDVTGALSHASALLIVVEGSYYVDHQQAARARLHEAGQKDWPLLALAIGTGDHIWTNDVDLFGTGVAVWSSHNIHHAQPLPHERAASS